MIDYGDEKTPVTLDEAIEWRDHDFSARKVAMTIATLRSTANTIIALHAEVDRLERANRNLLARVEVYERIARRDAT